MFSLTSTTVTAIKKYPKQSSELLLQDKKTVLPGAQYSSPFIKEDINGHLKIILNGEPWFIYPPHWKISLPQVQLSIKELQAIYPFTPLVTLQKALPSLQEGMDKFQISFNEQRIATFLAQIGHESGGLRYTVELASGQAYEWRKDLGNINLGDGARFKGRGWIQLTGRHNYRQAGKAIGIDLESNPNLAADDRYLGLLAAWFWNSRNLNFWADKGDFEKITRLINGGLNGYVDRINYWQRAKKALGI
jgi:putative chitinase